MITDAQKMNIRRMSKDDLLELLDICAEELGLVSKKEYREATYIPKSTVHYLIKKQSIKTFIISGIEYPLINYKTNANSTNL